MAASRREGDPQEDTIRDAAGVRSTEMSSGVTSSASASHPATRRSADLPAPGVAPKRLSPGDVVAEKYVVERTIGMGGMGQVVAARHVKLGTKVAIKIVHPEVALEADSVARFIQEAHAMARLRSEHTVRVLDVGETAGKAPYIIMELLEGRDLGDLLGEHGPLPVLLALDYVRQACDAIIEAHTAGIIHRDIKPQNLFLAKSASGKESVRVLDFGLAKAMESTFGGGVGKLTQTGFVLGTPHYMAPEQIRHDGLLTARTDVWALGVTLFRLLTREYPFTAPNPALASAMILTSAPTPIQRLRPDVPDAVAALIARCLTKEPSERFQSVRLLANAIDEARTAMTTPGHSHPPPMPMAIPAPPSPAHAMAPAPAPAPAPARPQSSSAALLVAIAALVGILCGAALLGLHFMKKRSAAAASPHASAAPSVTSAAPPPATAALPAPPPVVTSSPPAVSAAGGPTASAIATATTASPSRPRGTKGATPAASTSHGSVYDSL